MNYFTFPNFLFQAGTALPHFKFVLDKSFDVRKKSMQNNFSDYKCLTELKYTFWSAVISMILRKQTI